MPNEYQHASDDFDRFLVEVCAEADLATRNQAYTVVDGVLRAFRRWLEPRDAIRFAGVLPPVLRALFVADWDPDEPRRAFGDRAEMTREVQGLRPHHNFAPPGAIRDVAAALRRSVDGAALDAVLATLPEGATEFWRA